MLNVFCILFRSFLSFKNAEVSDRGLGTFSEPHAQGHDQAALAYMTLPRICKPYLEGQLKENLLH
jgi:hypothetical protein